MKQSNASSTQSSALAIVIDEGEVIDLSKIDVPTAMRVYPMVKGAADFLRRMIEIDMSKSGAQERIVPGVRYEFKSSEEWEVRDPVGLRGKLMLLAADESSGINHMEVEEAIPIVVTGKANNHKLNALEKRSKAVADAIAEFRTRSTTPARLKVK
ncbi:MAG TPA: hypothetical protein VFK94_06510 [Patescibacteria group bacterium]|nr:hypothetical protein [Patescibacteria group bacterium]